MCLLFENHAKLIFAVLPILLHHTTEWAIDFLDFSQKPRQTMLSNDGKTPKIIIAIISPHLSYKFHRWLLFFFASDAAAVLETVSRCSSFASPAPVKHWSQFMQHISTHQHASCGKAISSDSNI